MKRIALFILLFTVCLSGLSAESALPKADAGKGYTIVCFGDSLTAGTGVAKNKSYPALLGTMTGANVVNLGVHRDTSLDGYKRIGGVFEHSPDMVIIEFGANDMMQNVAFRLTIKTIEKMIDDVHAHGAVPVLVAVGKVPLMGPYNKKFKKIAAAKNAVFVDGLYNNMFFKRELKSDRLHPNEDGYQIFAERIYEGIKEHIK
ncbi:Lysophospholipase L1 [Parelusimicrobium proximum]|uniref:GDSL-type esterase/lipase family protein n=1 Tax=Parelusimicrobium proximum TaxID=3228953 RepID=UPI003D164CCA